MEATPAPPLERISVTPADLATIQEVYEAGRSLDAYGLSERLGPLRQWRGADALVLAGRLAANVGARRLSARLHLRARREEPASLAASVWATLSARLERRTVAWLSDWRRRDGAQPWMLLNLAVALRNLGRDSGSALVSRGALALPRDHTSAMHEVLLAADAALAGDAAAAARLGQPHRELEGFYRFLVEVIEALSTEEGQERRSGAAPSARLREAARRMGSLASDPYLRRVRIRAMRVVARREAGDGWLAPLRRMRAELGIR